MMSPDELTRVCEQLRYEGRIVDEELVAAIEADVAAYRAFVRGEVPQLPPPELADRLPEMGWLLYEATWQPLQQVATAFELLSGPAREASDAAAAMVIRLAEAARDLPWPEFAPRALGAIRAHALVESKRDTDVGYDEAWTIHQEGDKLYASHLDSHGDAAARQRYMLDLKEINIQLALAQTGTACRTPERVIGLWAEELDKAEPAWTDADGPGWTQRLFTQLHEGASVGDRSLRAAAEAQLIRPFGHRIDREHLALATWLRNPGIMTARAILLMLALSPGMEQLARHQPEQASWAAFRAQALTEFRRAYDYIEAEVIGEDGKEVELRAEHQRSLVQIRLNAALLLPGYDLPSRQVFADCLAINPLDDTAVQALSAWLAGPPGGPRRGDANVIGSATMPAFIESVVAYRRLSGVDSGYHEWRKQWLVLDRYIDQPDRDRRVRRVLERTRP